ncbi:hypothetical protein HYT23_06385 [Candidatus Pacearchaeota archaeon]|nr:hypothetical protein [Candidatus Pacearchaeota archaeon]
MEKKIYTPRERLVVNLSGMGMDYSEIAERLRMTSEDVRRIDRDYRSCQSHDRGYV